MHAFQIENTRSCDSKTKNIQFKLTAFENTWSHQRRKRREMKRRGDPLISECPEAKIMKPGVEASGNDTCGEISGKLQKTANEKDQEIPNKESDRKEIKETVTLSINKGKERESETGEEVSSGTHKSLTARDKDSFLIKCDLFVKLSSDVIHIEMVYQEGQKDQMHQILQYIKNHITD